MNCKTLFRILFVVILQSAPGEISFIPLFIQNNIKTETFLVTRLVVSDSTGGAGDPPRRKAVDGNQRSGRQGRRVPHQRGGSAAFSNRQISCHKCRFQVKLNDMLENILTQNNERISHLFCFHPREFVRAQRYKTEAETFGWSFVFQDFVSDEMKSKITQRIEVI